MCFSATASFTASGGLVVIGVASWRYATKKQKMLAAIPFLFAIQQCLEGLQWLNLNGGAPSIPLGYGFLFFAFLFWPMYIPVTVYVLDEKRRNITKWLIGTGIIAALLLMKFLVAEPLFIHVQNKCIQYSFNTPLSTLIALLYFAAVCSSLLLSSKKAFRGFGIAILVCAALAGLLFFETFISVWCFFSTILSLLIFLYLKPRALTSSKHKMRH